MSAQIDAPKYTYLKRGVYYFVMLCSVVATSLSSAANWNKSAVPKEVSPDQLMLIKFPTYFYANSLNPEFCVSSRTTSNLERKIDAAVSSLESNSDIAPGSTSLTVSHDQMSDAWKFLIDASTSAAALNDNDSSRAIIVALKRLVEREAFLTGSAGGKCWQNSASKCPAHSAQHRSFGAAALLISAINVRSFMTTQEEMEITKYAEKAYAKLLKNEARERFVKSKKGFYEFGHGSIPVIAYSAWIQDKNLLAKTYEQFEKWTRKVFEESGYVDNNSYRGVRGVFYHTLGVESALSAALIFKEHGLNVFDNDDILFRFKNALLKVDEGLLDYENFQSKGFRGSGFSKNYSTDIKDERRSVHSLAINLHPIASEMFGFKLAYQPSGRLKANGASKLSGLDAKCLFGSQN